MSEEHLALLLVATALHPQYPYLGDVEKDRILASIPALAANVLLSSTVSLHSTTTAASAAQAGLNTAEI